MTRRFIAASAASALTVIVTTTAVLAAEAEPAPPATPGATPDHRGMMMMQMSPEQRALMTRMMASMMEGCQRMMEGMTQAPHGSSGTPPSTPPR